MSEHAPKADASDFPLVRVTYPERPTVEGLPEYVEACRAFYARGRFVTVVDLRALSLLSNTAGNRRAIAEAMDELNREFPGRLIAEATVHPLAVVRAAVRAHNWLRKEGDFEAASFSTLDEAEAWARSKLAEAGLG